MPRKGYKVITIKEEIFKQAEEYVRQGKAKSISDLTEQAILLKIGVDQNAKEPKT